MMPIVGTIGIKRGKLDRGEEKEREGGKNRKGKKGEILQPLYLFPEPEGGNWKRDLKKKRVCKL